MALLAERNVLLRSAINIKLLRSCLLVFQHQAPTELFTRISMLLTSLLQRSKMFIAFGPSYMALLAERNVLLRSAINIKLLRSCLLVSQHQVPTELFTRISTPLTSLLRRSKMFIAFGPSYMALLAERNVLLRRAINIKLRRSCLLVFQHQAPTELFTRISTLLTDRPWLRDARGRSTR